MKADLKVKAWLTFSLFFFMVVYSDMMAQKKIKAGIGLTMGTMLSVDVDDPQEMNAGVGVNFNAAIEFNYKWELSPEYNLFLPSSPEEMSHKAYSLALETMYNFYNDGVSKLYGLAGLSYLEFDSEAEQALDTFKEFGVNLGGGGSIILDRRLDAFAEIKICTAVKIQPLLTVGFQYYLN